MSLPNKSQNRSKTGPIFWKYSCRHPNFRMDKMLRSVTFSCRAWHGEGGSGRRPSKSIRQAQSHPREQKDMRFSLIWSAASPTRE